MSKTKNLTLALVIAIAAGPVAADNRTAPAPKPAAAAPTPVATALSEIQGALGFVPAFIKAIPDSLLPGTWDQIKTLEMNPKTELDNKTKELIGLAVASQIPCDYCIYFHTKAAKANGATDAQIKEAVGMAALTRAGSTLMHGVQVDLPQYKKDVDRIFKAK